MSLNRFSIFRSRSSIGSDVSLFIGRHDAYVDHCQARSGVTAGTTRRKRVWILGACRTGPATAT